MFSYASSSTPRFHFILRSNENNAQENTRAAVVSRGRGRAPVNTSLNSLPNQEVVARVLGVPPASVRPFISQGQNSQVFVVLNVNDRLQHARNALGGRRLYTPISKPPAGRHTFFVKVTTSLHEGVHESRIFQYLRTQKPSIVSCEGMPPRTMDIRRHIPAFYGGGGIGSRYLQIMEYIPAKSIHSFGYSPRLMRLLEDAVLSMWTCGIVHGDLHPQNVLVRRNRLGNPVNVIIIDFGYAIRLPPKMKSLLFSRRCAPDTVNNVEELEEYVLKQQGGYKRDIYHTNVDALRRFALSNPKLETLPRRAYSPTSTLYTKSS